MPCLRFKVNMWLLEQPQTQEGNSKGTICYCHLNCNLAPSPNIYIVGKLGILAFIWRWAIEIWSILQAVRILLPSWDRIMHSYLHSVLWRNRVVLRFPSTWIVYFTKWSPKTDCRRKKKIISARVTHVLFLNQHFFFFIIALFCRNL